MQPDYQQIDRHLRFPFASSRRWLMIAGSLLIATLLLVLQMGSLWVGAVLAKGTNAAPADSPAQPDYVLVLTTVGAGDVHAAAPDADNVLTLTAVPAADWRFVSWQGDVVGDANPVTVVLASDLFVTATFVYQPPTADVQIHFAGYGAVDLSPNGPYTKGQPIQAVAVPAQGWRFEQWSGAVASYENPIIFSISATAELTATFAPVTDPPLPTIISAVEGEGRIELWPTAAYTIGQVISVTAIAADGWRFDHWQGDVAGVENPLLYTIGGNATLVAVFAPAPAEEPIMPTLTLTVAGEGDLYAEPSPPYWVGQIVTLTATPHRDWQFSGWGGALAGQTNPYALTLLTDTLAVATFVTTTPIVTTPITGTPTVTVAVVISGAGRVDVTPTPPYEAAQPMTITAIPEEGWRFVAWLNEGLGLSEQANPYSFAPATNLVITAAFAPIPPPPPLPLTVATRGEGIVEVSPPPPYFADQLVTLRALAADGWRFVDWVGDRNGDAPSVTFAITGPTSVTATFAEMEKPASLTLTVATEGEGAITAAPPGPYYPNQPVTLSANAAEGWMFVAWRGDLSGGGNPAAVVITDSLAITAVFAALTDVTPLALHVLTAGPGRVTIVPEGPYQRDQAVTLTAFPELGYCFQAWEGNHVSAANPVTLTMTADYTMTARLAPCPVLLPLVAK